MRIIAVLTNEQEMLKIADALRIPSRPSSAHAEIKMIKLAATTFTAVNILICLHKSIYIRIIAAFPS